MGNSRVKDRFELALDGKQVIALGIGVTVLVAGVFVLGMNLGRRSLIAAAPIAAPKDPLARLDEPLPVREETVELRAHQALTDARPIDKALPFPQVKTTPVAIAPTPVAPMVEVAPVHAERGAPAADAAAPPSKATPALRPALAGSAGRTERRREAPEPKAAPARKGAYAIQIASLPRRADAEKVARKNGARNPRIVQADVPGKGRHYRVLVGSFETQDAAKRQLAALSRAGVRGIVTAIR